MASDSSLLPDFRGISCVGVIVRAHTEAEAGNPYSIAWLVQILSAIFFPLYLEFFFLKITNHWKQTYFLFLLLHAAGYLYFKEKKKAIF